ncbi:MAG: TolB family protein [Phycisphaerae bacterium]
MRLGNGIGALPAVAVFVFPCALAHAQIVGNGRIAFSKPDVFGQPQIHTIQPDGTNEIQLTSLGTNMFPAWSEDGAKIAFSSNRTGSFEIWTMDPDGSNQTQITFNAITPPGGNFVPDWSPDGARFAYASMRNEVGHPEVWVMNTDGTNQTRLTFTPQNPPNVPTWSLHPSWAPDSARIVYASTFSGSSQIWMMNADGSNQVQMTDGNGPDFPESNASEWSRDGSKVAFWSGFETQFGEVWIMNPDGTNKQQLTVTVDPRNSDNPVWSPDGSKIVFDTNRAGPVELWVMDADGANPVPLVATSGGPASWQPVPLPPGDIDGDGDVDDADQVLFVAVLLGLDADPQHLARSDLSEDGFANGRDVTLFAAARLGGG